LLNAEDDVDSSNNLGVEEYDELRAYVKNKKQNEKNMDHASSNLAFADNDNKRDSLSGFLNEQKELDDQFRKTHSNERGESNSSLSESRGSGYIEPVVRLGTVTVRKN
jgi:hypothetical protein